MSELAGELSQYTRESDLFEPLEGSRIRCVACGHRCPIPSGFAGVCKVRYNQAGKLFAPYGYASGVHVDPIEKKPFFHVVPGCLALSFGMLGCNFHCGYCQNWFTSQTLRDWRAYGELIPLSPGDLVRMALRNRCEAVISTYNEPLITAEWARDVFREAKAAGLLTGMVSNGNATPEVLAYLRPCLDLFKIDLKTFDDPHYHELGGRLAPILDTVRRVHELGIWLESVTLVVPGFNDSDAELEAIAGFLAGVSPDIPWHVTAFHPDYKMMGTRATPASTLARAAAIGRQAGLRFVYAGNSPGSVGDCEDTRCPGCGAGLVRRWGNHVTERRIIAEGRCPACQLTIPGIWTSSKHRQELDVPLLHRKCG